MKKFLLSLSVTMLSFVGAWAQSIDKADTSDEVGAAVRRLEVVLSGDWLGGTDVEAKTEMLIDLIMGYEDGAFDADKAFTEVTIKSAEGTTVTVNQKLVQQLVTGKNIAGAWNTANSKIKRLDLSDVAVTHYVGHDGSATDNPNATLFAANGGICPIEYLAMPSFDTTVPGQTYSIPAYTTAWMPNLDELIIPVNTKKIEAAGFALCEFNKFKLNPGLEFIGNSAFWASSSKVGMETLDIPASVKYIGPGAFNFRIYTDLYFHSAQAPVCPMGKNVINGDVVPFVYDICYQGNGGQNTTEGDDYEHGYANRSNYKNREYWFLMIHFPSSTECAARGEVLDISSYKDATRVYNKLYGNFNNTTQYGPVEIAQVGNRYPVLPNADGTIGSGQNYVPGESYYWDGSNAIDYVGQETTALTYQGKSTFVESGKGAYVNSGYEDTYRGLNYIWPSVSQYNRAFVTVALGFNWDGVTKYRPELTKEQILLMAEDNFEFENCTDNENGVPTGTGQYVKMTDVYYSTKTAAAHNETLDGAWIPGVTVKETYTQEEADAYNESLMVHENDPVYYTEEEVINHNATLEVEGAVHEGQYKETKTLSYEEYIEEAKKRLGYELGWTEEDFNNKVNSTNPYEYWPFPYKIDINYTKEEAAEANAGLDGAISTFDVKYYLTAEQAAEINANNPNLIAAGDPKSYYTEAEAIAHNAELSDAVKAGDEVEGSEDYSDDLSRLAFMSTRLCVFGANDGGGDDYDPKIPSSQAWWTICLPFDLTKAQIDKYFGVGTHVCKFNRVDRNVNPTQEGVKPFVKFYFTDDQYPDKAAEDVVLEAHQAYMIFPTISEEDAVYLKNGIPMSEYYKKTGNPEPTIVKANVGVDTDDHQEYRFVGNYDTKLPVVKEDGSVENIDVVVPQYSYIYAKKANATGKHPYQFWFAQAKTIKWGANKCVIQSTDRDGGIVDNETFFTKEVQAAKGQTQQITILGDEADDSEATAIDVIIIAGNGEDSQVIYNLNGQKLNAVPQNGVFIKNGKKYIAK